MHETNGHGRSPSRSPRARGARSPRLGVEQPPELELALGHALDADRPRAHVALATRSALLARDGTATSPRAGRAPLLVWSNEGFFVCNFPDAAPRPIVLRDPCAAPSRRLADKPATAAGTPAGLSRATQRSPRPTLPCARRFFALRNAQALHGPHIKKLSVLVKDRGDNRRTIPRVDLHLKPGERSWSIDHCPIF